MLGHFGFSYIGLIYLLLLIIPNSLWARNKPEAYDLSRENKTLQLFERAGQILCTAAILLFSDYNPQTLELWTLWLFASALLMLLYEVYWLRYFKSRKTIRDFYRPLLAVPVPGAVFPVAAFLLLGIYGKVIWLVVSAVIFGIGHIGIHLQHLKQLNK
jgi:hypothetical protein